MKQLLTEDRIQLTEQEQEQLKDMKLGGCIVKCPLKNGKHLIDTISQISHSFNGDLITLFLLDEILELLCASTTSKIIGFCTHQSNPQLSKASTYNLPPGLMACRMTLCNLG